MGTRPASIRIFGIAEDSIVDGPGLRFAVFVQGCPHRCPGCHNPESHSFDGGYLQRIDELVERIARNKLTQGVTVSGGEPFEQCAEVLELVRCLKREGYGIWIYSGYTFEQLVSGTPSELAPELLQLCDVLVDGRYDEGSGSYELSWRGSSNQRLIDLRESLTRGEPVIWKPESLRF